MCRVWRFFSVVDSVFDAVCSVVFGTQFVLIDLMKILKMERYGIFGLEYNKEFMDAVNEWWEQKEEANGILLYDNKLNRSVLNMLSHTKYQLVVNALWAVFLVVSAFVTLPEGWNESTFYSIAGVVWMILVLCGIGKEDTRQRKLRHGMK